MRKNRLSQQYQELWHLIQTEKNKYSTASWVCGLYCLLWLGLIIYIESLWFLVLLIVQGALMWQSLRGVNYLSELEHKLKLKADSVSREEIKNGPVLMGIPGLNFFISLTR